MRKSLFEIVNKKHQTSFKQKESAYSSYQNLYQKYISLSYGYYIENFIKKITQKSILKNQKLLQFELRKLLREVVKNFLMTDLQIIYLAYFANLHQWNYSHLAIIEALNNNQNDPQIIELNKIKLFLNLIAFFVKSFVGQKQQLTILIDFYRQNIPIFLPIFKIWLDQNPKNLFIISPRQLNQIYTQYSRNCGEKTNRKDYNEMVDKILDLSTTYSIIPQKKRKINQSFVPNTEKEKSKIPSSPKKFNRKQSLSDLQKSYKIDFSDLRSQKKQSIILAGLSNLFVPNLDNEKIQRKIQNKQQPRKLISLNKKNKKNIDEPNNVAKSFFCNKEIKFNNMEETKKNDNNSKDQINFLDIDSRIQNVPFVYRNSSNIFGLSNMF